MRNNAYLQTNQYSIDHLKEKERIFINTSQTQCSTFQSASKTPITQSSSFQPISIQQKSLPITIRSQEYASTQASKSVLSVQNPEKTKQSSSLYQKNPKPKFEYLAFIQKQLKDEKGKKVNFTSILQSEHRLTDDLQQIKSKLESYYAQLQKKDELIVKKEKELFDSNKRYELAIERIDLLENKCKQLDHHNHDLYQQCLRYQENEEYNSKLFDNYRILSEKCSQIEQILQQKDAYIESIIGAKTKEYDNAIITKNHEIKALQERISILQSENALLVSNLKNQTTTPKPIPVSSPQDIDPSKFSAFRDEFESKINYYINENSRLKNIIGHYEGQLEQLKVQLNSLKSTIHAYQDRDNIQKGSKLEEQINFLRDALDMEKMEKDQLASRHELEILKLENLLSEKREASERSLLNFCDREKLRESLYLALEEVAKLNRKLLQKQGREAV